MKLFRAALLVGCLVLSTAAAAERNTTHDDGLPPRKYMGDNITITRFTHDVHPDCGEDPPGYILEACQFDPAPGQPSSTLILPNPCAPIYASQSYARTVCHELGHANGWAADHPSH